MSEIATSARPPRKFRRPALASAAVAAVAVAALLGVTLSGGKDTTAFAAPLVRIAEAAPRLLLAARGWTVTRADEFGIGYGEMTFSNGDRTLELHWDRGHDLGNGLGERGSGTTALGATAVQGVTARLFRYDGSPDYAATWTQDGYGLEARGAAPDLPSFKALVATLREVGVETWLSAMPPSVVKPQGRNKIVLSMLEGVPLPPGYDVASLLRADGAAVVDRYQLGAQVSGSVACAWLRLWVAARAAGNDSGARRATGALATAHHWRVLREMQAQGDYPEVLWQYADAAAGDGTVVGGRKLSVEASYRDALGCR
jgi:hypothetical protein